MQFPQHPVPTASMIPGEAYVGRRTLGLNAMPGDRIGSRASIVEAITVGIRAAPAVI
jgi:hypothetical protein